VFSGYADTVTIKWPPLLRHHDECVSAQIRPDACNIASQPLSGFESVHRTIMQATRFVDDALPAEEIEVKASHVACFP
jgi:hypothetical protein